VFDYNAGEKYRLTLVMTAVAGIMAGAFFTMLLATSSSPPPQRRQAQASSQEPASSVRYGAPPQGMAAAVAPTTAASATGAQPSAAAIDPKDAKDLIQQWLPLAWDLSAGTAAQDQDVAMRYMTPECAQSYRNTIWTPDLAKQIDEAGLRSSFDVNAISEPVIQGDGSAVIDVAGTQTITAANGQTSQRQVRLEYSLIDTPAGPRIASFKESGGNG
jgi:hypothetical protein